ncbi:hypothetical protein EG341_06895 [Chryseobacterium lactis]|nr:hypothetical protein EG341_06895 [Chryseobacterium lactis]
MKRYISILILLLLPVFSLAQSDVDKDQQELYSYLYSGQLDKAKMLIENNFLKSGNKSRQIIGYAYLTQYYTLTDARNKDIEVINSIKKAKKLRPKPERKLMKLMLSMLILCIMLRSISGICMLNHL